jgi:hypothetical protein
VGRFSRNLAYAGSDSYRPGDAWFTCDRCSGRYRRSAMLTEWTGLKVDAGCLDPRPPQMSPPEVYPEGLPFLDARPPQDRPDRLQDDTSLQSTTGGMLAPYGQLYPNGQNPQPGALSPLQLVETPTPQGPSVLADDVTFVTGPVSAPDAASPAPVDGAPVCTAAPTISGTPALGATLTGGVGTWTGSP